MQVPRWHLAFMTIETLQSFLLLKQTGNVPPIHTLHTESFFCRSSPCCPFGEQDKDGSGNKDSGVEGIIEGIADLSSEDGAVADPQCDEDDQCSGVVQGARKHSRTGMVH